MFHREWWAEKKINFSSTHDFESADVFAFFSSGGDYVSCQCSLPFAVKLIAEGHFRGFTRRRIFNRTEE
jgi:hypothetical protein